MNDDTTWGTHSADEGAPASSETVGADTTSDPDKDTTEAAPEPVTPNPSDPTGHEVTTPLSSKTQDEGVQTGGLTFTETKDADGEIVRNYPEQAKDVDVTEEPASDR